MLDFLIAAAEPSLSIEGLLIKLVTTTGGVGLAAFFAYIIYKLVMRKQNGAAHNHPPAATPATGLPVLGGSNPAGDERSGVTIISPEKQPVTNEVCVERQRVLTTKLDAVGEQIEKYDNNLADTNSKIDATATRLDKTVGKLDKAVAVLKDRMNRGG